MPKPHIIAVVNQKGGTGKTTTTVNLGRAIAEFGKKVLLMDLDPQGSLSYYLGANSNVWSISDVILEDISFHNALIQRENMHIIPADVTLADLELSLVNYQGREQIVKKMIEQHAQEYDYILIDCSPSLSILTVNALVAAHSIIIPLQMEVLSMHGLELILETIEQVKKTVNPELQIMGILILMYNIRRRITQEVHNHIKKTYNFVPIFQTHIRTDVKLVEAPSFGKSVFEYAPQSNGAEDYLNLAREIIAKEAMS
ncbi:MAG: ParA family protein [Raineya sp.]|jgi:chromosome partitioning protein|nr:ParA family protein [Raineya sp.]